MEKTKRCTSCGVVKTLDEFYANITGHHCKVCRRKNMVKSAQKWRDKVKAKKIELYGTPVVPAKDPYRNERVWLKERSPEILALHMREKELGLRYRDEQKKWRPTKTEIAKIKRAYKTNINKIITIGLKEGWVVK